MSQNGGGGSPESDLKWLIIIILGLWALWYFSGGPGYDSVNDPFVKPANPIDTGETYGR